jgi:hypothetical protein
MATMKLEELTKKDHTSEPKNYNNFLICKQLR